MAPSLVSFPSSFPSRDLSLNPRLCFANFGISHKIPHKKMYLQSKISFLEWKSWCRSGVQSRNQAATFHWLSRYYVWLKHRHEYITQFHILGALVLTDKRHYLDFVTSYGNTFNQYGSNHETRPLKCYHRYWLINENINKHKNLRGIVGSVASESRSMQRVSVWGMGLRS